MSETNLTPYQLPAPARMGLTALAVLGAAGSAAAVAYGGVEAWRGFLLMAMLMVTLTMGAGFFMALHYATQASWNIYLRRMTEGLVASILPVAVIVAVVVFAGHHSHLYHWMDADAMAHDEVLRAKAAWLNLPFFTARSVAYLAGWTLLLGAIIRQSRKQDADGDPRHTVIARRLSFAFLVFFGPTFPFAMMDWIMGLEPHWFSSIYGVIAFGGAHQAALALMILLALYLRKAGVLPQVNGSHLHDLGKLMFAFSAFWMYTWFSQFMLIWYAHLPEETTFFILRNNAGWLWVTLLLPVLRFGVPFFLIASQANKRNPAVLIPVCVLILLGHMLDLFWLIYPSGHEAGPPASLAPLGFLAAGWGMLLWLFFRNFGGRAPVPSRDPGLGYSVHHNL